MGQPMQGACEDPVEKWGNSLDKLMALWRSRLSRRDCLCARDALPRDCTEPPDPVCVPHKFRGVAGIDLPVHGALWR